MRDQAVLMLPARADSAHYLALDHVDSLALLSYPETMNIEIGCTVTLPRFTPYPRHGRVVAVTDEGVQVDNVLCGDPRCAAEHSHSPQTWPLADVEAVTAYQPRAAWERGRKSSPNAPLT